jgi:hypothetical protein
VRPGIFGYLTSVDRDSPRLVPAPYNGVRLKNFWQIFMGHLMNIAWEALLVRKEEFIAKDDEQEKRKERQRRGY